MNKIRRIYVEKREAYATKARGLKNELKDYLGIDGLEHVRILNRYDIENVSDETYNKALRKVFSNIPVDIITEENYQSQETDKVFTAQYLLGQFDQMADSAEQSLKLIDEDEEAIVRCATTYILSGDISDEEFERIKVYCINPVDSREIGEEKSKTLAMQYDEPDKVKYIDGFKDMKEDELADLYSSMNLAMTIDDFKHIQNYFKDEEDRDPSITEIKVLDTYWSDHCRHTTFHTELKDITFEESYYTEPIKAAYNTYLADRDKLYKDRDDKYISLMDLGTLAMKKLRADGKLEDMEVSDEINACSIIVPVEIDGETEEWLIFFKNETHNHPTEIEPFGGASTCLGGAIRDPLSGRGYVYQAMRITGAADPRTKIEDTLEGKLPQRKICKVAADGYSSYGNQIGVAGSLANEIYHPNYIAKRMECGAVMAAAPRKNVIRENPQPGDLIIMLGGRTGRDGLGGATGSSKVHTTESAEECGAEVQKGNPPTEGKIQRLFYRPEVSRLIKKCNDFGAGGVSVAIGELADGLYIDLDKVPAKYEGLDGTELAISESQERMALVVDPKDADKILKYSEEENLEAVVVAKVTKEPRLVLAWKGDKIVDLSRDFLDSNGAHQETTAHVTMPNQQENYLANGVFENINDRNFKEDDTKKLWLEMLSDINICSQKGLGEMFDSSVGGIISAMPYGGKYQLSPMQTMVSKLPVLKGECDTVTMMSYGFDPYFMTWSPFHGAVYSVISSVAKIVATGGDYSKIRFSFQEFFKRLGDDPARWGEPLVALLGAYDAQVKLELPSIGGKDSMSGTFNDIDVPPTLVSFAVNTGKIDDIVTTELKKAGDLLVRFSLKKDDYDLPNYKQLKSLYGEINKLMKAGAVTAAYAIGQGGIVEAVSKMAFGNKLGVNLEDELTYSDLFLPGYGSIILAIPKEKLDDLKADDYELIGQVTDKQVFTYQGQAISMEEALEAWTGTLEEVYPTKLDDDKAIEAKSFDLYDVNKVYTAKNKIAKPKVFIPIFPGTNNEYNTVKAFEDAGGEVESIVFKNLLSGDIEGTIKAYEKAIKQSQILMLSSGLSPEFINIAMGKERIKDAIMQLLEERDGLILGISDGFQALIKLGLLPYGKFASQNEDSIALTTNTIGRFTAKHVNTKLVSNKSPWLMKAELGQVYNLPVAHDKGRFVASDDMIKKLFDNGQVASQYADHKGNPTMDIEHNPNGSFHGIEGILSPDGRVFGKMAYSQRIGDGVAVNISGNQNQYIFESGVSYFQ